jgi:hypothetical protein
VQNLEERVAYNQRDLADSEKKCGELETKIGQPFEHEAKLQSLAQRQQQLEDALDITKNQAANSLPAAESRLKSVKGFEELPLALYASLRLARMLCVHDWVTSCFGQVCHSGVSTLKLTWVSVLLNSSFSEMFHRFAMKPSILTPRSRISLCVQFSKPATSRSPNEPLK